MVSKTIEPDTVAGTAEAMAFGGDDEAAGCTGFGGAGPVDGWVEVCPGVGHGADFEKLAEEGDGLRWSRAREMWGLGSVVGAEGDGRGKGTKLVFGG